MFSHPILLDKGKGAEKVPIQVTAPSKLWTCGLSLAGIVGSIPAWSIDICLVWVLWCVR